MIISGASPSRPRLHIAVDTGLGRFGFLPSEYGKILSVYRNPALSVEGIYTHFACASGSRRRTKKQFRLFASLLSSLSADGIARGMAHAAASTALFRYEDMRLDAVRTGSALTGRAGSLPPSETGLVRAGTLIADVCDVRSLPRGSRLGYGGEARLHRPSEIAVLSCGRQAGLLPPPLLARLRGRYGTVRIDGRPFPVLSSRSAGYLLADVTGAGIRPGALVRADVNPLFVDGRIRRVYL